MRKSRKLNVDFFTYNSFPHPLFKDGKEIAKMGFDLFDTVFALYSDLLISRENERAEKLIKAASRVHKHLRLAVAAENISDFRNEIELIIDFITETRFWLKELQMKYPVSSICDASVGKVNELIKILTYVSGRMNEEFVSARLITVN